MNRPDYEARKAGIKRMRAAAGAELDRLRRTPGHDPAYRRAVARYRAIQDVLSEFVRKNCQPRGGSLIVRSSTGRSRSLTD